MNEKSEQINNLICFRYLFSKHKTFLVFDESLHIVENKKIEAAIASEMWKQQEFFLY